MTLFKGWLCPSPMDIHLRCGYSEHFSNTFIKIIKWCQILANLCCLIWCQIVGKKSSKCLNNRFNHKMITIVFYRTSFLKLNDEKTEFMLFGSHQQLSKINIGCIHIGDSSIASASQARNLGAIFDSSMTMKPNISNVIRSSAFQIRNISRIRKYLSRDATEQIIHSFITPCLDNNNALLYGLPANQHYRL